MTILDRRWLSARLAADYISVSPRTLRAWALDGTLPRGSVARIVRRDAKGRGRHLCTIRVDKFALDEFLTRIAR